MDVEEDTHYYSVLRTTYHYRPSTATLPACSDGGGSRRRRRYACSHQTLVSEEKKKKKKWRIFSLWFMRKSRFM